MSERERLDPHRHPKLQPRHYRLPHIYVKKLSGLGSLFSIALKLPVSSSSSGLLVYGFRGNAELSRRKSTMEPFKIFNCIIM